MHAMDTRDVRCRVMPHYPIDQAMLAPDGQTLLEPHATSYVGFLATHIADLIAYFESRHHRTRGEVNLVDDGQAASTSINATPPRFWGTPNTSRVSWNNNTLHSTPHDGPSKPQSGVSSFSPVGSG